MRARQIALPLLLALTASAAHARGLSVSLNHSVRVPLAGPAQSVVVGSPSVVDVAVVDSRTVYVSGKSAGSTDVTVIDPIGRVVYRGEVTVAGGSAVSVFRGSTRTDATCAPYCHDLAADQTLPTGGAVPTPGTMSPLAAMVTGSTIATTGSQAVATAPSAKALR